MIIPTIVLEFFWEPDSENPITLIPQNGSDYKGDYFKMEVIFKDSYQLEKEAEKMKKKIF